MHVLVRLPPLALLLACVTLTLLPACAEAEPAKLLGAQSHVLWTDSTAADMERELDLLDRAGATAVRLDISWSSLETDGKGQISQWYVNRFESFLKGAEARGIRVIGTLWSTPCWASSAPETLKQGCEGAWWERTVDRYPPTSAADYADIAAWVARRWGSRLAAIEIWNEPNLEEQNFLKASDPAAAYAELVKAAHPRIKAEAAGLTVLAGALAFSDDRFLERLYSLGIKGKFDGLSFHPYNEWRDPDDAWKPEWRKYTFVTGVPYMREVLRRHGDGSKRLWLTEFGWSTCGTGDRWCVSEGEQAQYVADAIRIVRGWDFVEAAIVYNLRNKGSNPTDREHQFGLLHRDFTPKPGYHAFARALQGAGGTARTVTKRGRGRVRILGRRRLALRRSGVLRLRVACTASLPCVGRLELTRAARGSRRRRAAARHFAIAAGRTRVVRLRLSRTTRRVVRRRGRARVIAVASTRQAGVHRRSLAVIARR